jgi:ADP-heptose:LPS heptosyltransferase
MEVLSFAKIQPAVEQPQGYGFTLATGLVQRKFKRRIVIHPASQSASQHWDDVKWVSLARQLRDRGWQLAFLVKPAERTYWLSLTRGEFEIPVIHNLNETMGFIYESTLLIDNDSGHGPLATTIGCPVVTIDHSKHQTPPWVLGNPLVYKVAPRFTLKLFQKRIWRPFLSVGDIYKTVVRVLADIPL